jgi:hypothetical protein
MQRVAFLREYDASERAGKNDMPGLKRVPVRTNLVGKPGHAERRMAQHTGGQAGLLDLRIAVMMPPTQRRSTSIGPTGRPPIAMPAAAPLSATVSTILR